MRTRSSAPLDDPRTAFKPEDPDRRGPAFTLSLLVHAGLVGALAWGVAWRSDKPTPIAAELWSAVPKTAAPPAAPPPAPTPAPPPEPAKPPPKPAPAPEPKPPAPAPAPKPAPKPEPDRAAAAREAEIATEKARKKKAEEDRLAEQKRSELLKAQQEREKQAEEAARKKALAEKDRQRELQQQQQQAAEDARLAKLREERLRSIASAPPAQGAPTSRGTDTVDAAPSNAYKGRLVGVIKPNIVFGDPIVGNPVAEVEVRTAPTGTIVSNRLLKSSGNRTWDQAVIKAVEKTAVLPKDEAGRVPPVIVLVFSPQE